MVIPCIDLMGRKVVQLVGGREDRKVLALPDPIAVLEKFSSYPEIQVIDLDAALGRAGQPDVVRELAARKPCRVGGGIRTVERAVEAVEWGAHKIIIGSAAFRAGEVNREFLTELRRAVPGEKLIIAVDSLGGRIAVHGWREVLPIRSRDALAELEPYCSEFLATYIDAEGKLEGTNLEWFRELRTATRHTITAAGGITTDEEISALDTLGIHAALGMAIYRKVFPECFS